MSKLLEISLGVITSVGGFLEAGSLATAVQAGVAFRYQLIWAIVLGTICLIFLVEMAGRFAAVSKHTITDAIRERFGFNFFLLPLIVVSLVNLLVLSAEIGGICLALQFVTGIAFPVWALPVALLMWILLWKGTFGLIEKGVSLLGLVTLCFVVAVVVLRPDWGAVAKGALPTLPAHDSGEYWYMAVNILGASISPYLFLFYSSGAVEEQWDESYLWVNRAVAGLGMPFGGAIAIGALIVAVLVFPPRGVMEIDSYDQIAMILTPVFGRTGFYLFAASLGIACLGAALELALCQAYVVAQGLGWHWGENLPPKKDPGFSLTYTIVIAAGALPILLALDPLKLTIFSMGLTAMSLPLAVLPFLVLMNDEKYVGKHTNGWIGNAAVIAIVGLGFLLALVTVPLQIIGG